MITPAIGWKPIGEAPKDRLVIVARIEGECLHYAVSAMWGTDVFVDEGQPGRSGWYISSLFLVDQTNQRRVIGGRLSRTAAPTHYLEVMGVEIERFGQK
jgi:hypothetical protein